jgi:urease accessory protein
LRALAKQSTLPASAPHQRAYGTLRVAFKRRGPLTVLEDLRQEGCLKARFPRPIDWPEAVLLNTSGGIAGGDRLSIDLEVGQGAAACFTAQAAERFYRALPGDPPARIRTTLKIGPGAAAEWLPQESILFDRCALDRQLAIEAHADSWFLGVETLLFGRLRSGETIATARIADTIRIRRANRLILHDAIRLDGPVNDLLQNRAIAAGGAAVATLIHVAPDAESRLEVLRAAWQTTTAETGASAWDGMLIGRILAPDGASLRAAIVAGLAALRAGRPLPRVWQC